MILNRESDYFDLLVETGQVHGIPAITYGRADTTDVQVKSLENQTQAFELITHSSELPVEAEYEIKLAGGFNQENAASAIIAATLVGASISDAQQGLSEARVPGRMDQLTHKNGAHVYVDYAHNYLSLKTLLAFAKNEHPNGRVIVVLGSPGNKAISRRKDFGESCQKQPMSFFLTADDPAFEDPQKLQKKSMLRSRIQNWLFIMKWTVRLQSN